MKSPKYMSLQKTTLGLSALLCFSLTNPVFGAGTDNLPNGRPFTMLHQLIVQNQNAIAGVTSVSQTLIADLDALKLKVAALSDRVSANETAIADLQSSIAGLIATIQNALQQIAANEARIAQLKLDTAANAAEITQLTATVADLQAQVAANRTELLGEIGQLRANCEGEAQQLADLQNQVAANNASVQNQISQILIGIASLQAKLNSQDVTIDSLLATVATLASLNGQVTTLFAQTSSLQTQLNNLSTKFDHHYHHLFADTMITMIHDHVLWLEWDILTNPTTLEPSLWYQP